MVVVVVVLVVVVLVVVDMTVRLQISAPSHPVVPPPAPACGLRGYAL